jgi:acylphosphatase
MNQKPWSENKDRVRAHIWVKGRVQGVGFRAHVEYATRQIGGLTGWVRNVGYDTVEAIAEGERTNVDRLIEAMKQGPRSSRVDDSNVEWETPTGEFTQFGVKRSI